jgi:RNA polymerase sigma factor (sigma-70 family)
VAPKCGFASASVPCRSRRAHGAGGRTVVTSTAFRTSSLVTMPKTADVSDRDWLSERFEEERPQLRGIAYRMLGTLDEADDAVQEAWLRLSGTDEAAVENLGAWLTTVVGRVSLDMLRARRARREDQVGSWLPEPIVTVDRAPSPEEEALIADSVGLALMVVLETLTPSERLAFVLHDMFELPFDEIAPIVGRSPAAARQLASRARRRVRGAPVPDADLGRQRAAVDAFLTAARKGDFEALLAVLDPDVVLRADRAAPPGAATEVRGARAVAARALTFSRLAEFARPALVNGAAGLVVTPHGRPFSVMGFTVKDGKIVEIDILADPVRLARLDLVVLGEAPRRRTR